MVTMTNCGITISVHKADVNFYKSAGYTVVVEPAPVPIEPTAEKAEETPVKKTGKK